jgi:putative hydrolase of HD superfamily
MWVLDEEQFENDSEHSFQLALTALYIIQHKRLKLDPYRSMALGLVHDILEVHSGDTHIYGSQEAITQLKAQWPDFDLLHELKAEYENKYSPESKFIYALDKLVPILNNYLDGGRNWKREGITLDKIISVKTDKIRSDETINEYYVEILGLLRSKPELFTDR